LHPINFAEPFGLSVVEAMACGTPVIAFNKGSMPEIISSGVDGFLVENVEQAVAAVKRLGDIDRTRCRQAVEKRFTVERMAQKYARVYEGILGMSSG
jgi:glycosyltransferase involved in cell wall biosynthesis